VPSAFKQEHPLEGQRVTFLERGPSAGHPIGVAQGPAGTLEFTPRSACGSTTAAGCWSAPAGRVRRCAASRRTAAAA
jgi:hypothetical protein